jgi:hypothetical protein
MKNEIYSLAGHLRTTYHRKINNTHIWTSIAHDAIAVASVDPSILSSGKFSVPSKSGKRVRTIKRTRSDLEAVLQTAESTDFYHLVHTYIVAQVEAFFSDLIAGVLRIDKRRLKTKVSGVDHISKIEITEVIDASDIDEIIEGIIEKELVGIFYASPVKQREYLEKAIGIKKDDRIEPLFGKWFEYKATRDIIVHNSGLVNDLYIKKAGSNAVWGVGDDVELDQKYLSALVADSKSLIGKICSSIQRKNKA